MDSAVLDNVRDNALTQAAMKATGLTLEELAANVKIEPGEPMFPETWPLSFPAGLFPDACLLAVHPLAVMLWLYSNNAEHHPDCQAAAGRYLVEHEYALAYSDGVAVQKGRSTGGENAGVERREAAQQKHSEIIERWHSLGSRPERNRAAIIAERLGYTSKHVREVLRKANLR
jgi:hypothetical protein